MLFICRMRIVHHKINSSWILHIWMCISQWGAQIRSHFHGKSPRKLIWVCFGWPPFLNNDNQQVKKKNSKATLRRPTRHAMPISQWDESFWAGVSPAETSGSSNQSREARRQFCVHEGYSIDQERNRRGSYELTFLLQKGTKHIIGTNTATVNMVDDWVIKTMYATKRRRKNTKMWVFQ